MATCTDAEKALLEAWLGGCDGKEFRRRRVAVLKERVDEDLRGRVTRAGADFLKARSRWYDARGQLIDRLTGGMGGSSTDIDEIMDNIEKDAAELAGEKP